MIGLGTVIDVALLIAGGLAGLLGRRFITPRVQDALLKASALCVLFIGLAGTLEKMLEVTNDGLASGGAGMIIVSFTVGTLIGELLNLELRMEHLGEWLRDRFAGDSENGFVDAFVTTSLTVCVGAMAIVGSIQDGILGDYTTLTIKGALRLHHGLCHDCLHGPWRHLLRVASSGLSGHHHDFRALYRAVHDRMGAQQLIARRIHAHLLRRRQSYLGQDL